MVGNVVGPAVSSMADGKRYHWKILKSQWQSYQNWLLTRITMKKGDIKELRKSIEHNPLHRCTYCPEGSRERYTFK